MRRVFCIKIWQYRLLFDWWSCVTRTGDVPMVKMRTEAVNRSMALISRGSLTVVDSCSLLQVESHSHVWHMTGISHLGPDVFIRG